MFQESCCFGTLEVDEGSQDRKGTIRRRYRKTDTDFSPYERSKVPRTATDRCPLKLS